MSLMTKRCLIYTRVSTKRQNLKTQLFPLRQFARQRGWKVVDELADFGISGRKKDRPAENQVMDLAHRRAFDVLLVYKLDRFGRSLVHLLRALEEFRAKGIDLCSYSQREIDTTTPLGKMFFAIAAAFAELEADQIRERVMAGLDRARAQGKRLGRPRTVVLEAGQVRRALKGRTWREAAAALRTNTAAMRRVLLQKPPHKRGGGARRNTPAAAGVS